MLFFSLFVYIPSGSYWLVSSYIRFIYQWFYTKCGYIPMTTFLWDIVNWYLILYMLYMSKTIYFVKFFYLINMNKIIIFNNPTSAPTRHNFIYKVWPRLWAFSSWSDFRNLSELNVIKNCYLKCFPLNVFCMLNIKFYLCLRKCIPCFHGLQNKSLS